MVLVRLQGLVRAAVRRLHDLHLLRLPHLLHHLRRPPGRRDRESNRGHRDPHVRIRRRGPVRALLGSAPHHHEPDGPHPGLRHHPIRLLQVSDVWLGLPPNLI